MSSEEHELWDKLNIEYEHAYRNAPFKKACVEKAITLLKPGARVLDIGCGTGVPVAQMLAEGGMAVFGCDVSPNMIQHARSRDMGTFELSDMVEYQPPEGQYAAIFIIYSHLGLSYAAFHGAVSRLSKTLQPGGIIAIGQSPTDPEDIADDDPTWDETKTYVEGYNLPFWGEPFATLMFTRKGQKQFLESMGFEVVYDTLDVFQPDNSKCDPEYQQYTIARRKDGVALSEPRPLPTHKG